MKKPRTWSQYARHAALLLGERIRLARRQRRWSEQDLAARAGISRATLRKIESGEMGCSVGLAFEAAVLVGIPLFESEERLSLQSQIRQTKDMTALLPHPQRAKAADTEVFDDF